MCNVIQLRISQQVESTLWLTVLASHICFLYFRHTAIPPDLLLKSSERSSQYTCIASTYYLSRSYGKNLFRAKLTSCDLVVHVCHVFDVTHTLRTHTRTHTLLYALYIKDLGQYLEMVLVHTDRFGLVYDNLPFWPVFHYLLPVGSPYQVPCSHLCLRCS